MIDGVVVASVLAAIMSTVDSQLLVCASSVTHDLLDRKHPRGMLRVARATVLVIGVGALVAALMLPKDVFGNVMFAWAALGSAFGPLLLVRLCRGPVAPNWAFASMVAGGGAAVLAFYLNKMSITEIPGGFLDRVVSWFLAAGIALMGTGRNSR